jgi:hypothetical protein
MTEISDDHLFMDFGGTVTLEDGTRHPFEINITVGMVRKYRDHPNPCRCKECLEIFPTAIKMLALMEDWHAGKITRKQFDQRMRKLGYSRKGRIQHH